MGVSDSRPSKSHDFAQTESNSFWKNSLEVYLLPFNGCTGTDGYPTLGQAKTNLPERQYPSFLAYFHLLSDYMKSFVARNRLFQKIRLTFSKEIQRKANDGSQKSSYRTQQ